MYWIIVSEVKLSEFRLYVYGGVRNFRRGKFSMPGFFRHREVSPLEIFAAGNVHRVEISPQENFAEN